MSSKAGSGNAVAEARSITATLRRTKQTMEAGVMQADSAVSILLKDASYLAGTLDEHKYHLKGALSSTRSRIEKLKSAEARERFSIVLALLFFTSVVVFIIARRLRVFSMIYFSIQTFRTTGKFVSDVSTYYTKKPTETLQQLQQPMHNEFAKEANSEKTGDVAGETDKVNFELTKEEVHKLCKVGILDGNRCKLVAAEYASEEVHADKPESSGGPSGKARTPKFEDVVEIAQSKEKDSKADMLSHSPKSDQELGNNDPPLRDPEVDLSEKEPAGHSEL